MEIATQPIVTVQARLQKTAYPALLQRRKRIEEAALFFLVFNVLVVILRRKSKQNTLDKQLYNEKKVLLNPETPFSYIFYSYWRKKFLRFNLPVHTSEYEVEADLPPMIKIR